MEYLLRAGQSLPLLLDGLAVTAGICALAVALALAGAVAIVAVRRAGPRWLALAAAVFVALMRGLPIVVLVFLLYFGLPTLLGLGRVSAFWVGVIALALNGAAFMSEVLRGAIARLPAGQGDAARALGLRPWQVWRRVLVPQLLPVALPALAGEIGFIVKASPVLSLITVVDLTRRAQQVTMQTFDPLAPLLAAALLYFLLIGAVAAAARRLERRLSPEGWG